MKITESTSISLKLLMPIIGLAFGFGSWMWPMYNSVKKIPGMNKKIIRVETKVDGMETKLDNIKTLLIDNKLAGILEDDWDCEYDGCDEEIANH